MLDIRDSVVQKNVSCYVKVVEGRVVNGCRSLWWEEARVAEGTELAHSQL